MRRLSPGRPGELADHQGSYISVASSWDVGMDAPPLVGQEGAAWPPVPRNTWTPFQAAVNRVLLGGPCLGAAPMRGTSSERLIVCSVNTHRGACTGWCGAPFLPVPASEPHPPWAPWEGGCDACRW